MGILNNNVPNAPGNVNCYLSSIFDGPFLILQDNTTPFGVLLASVICRDLNNNYDITRMSVLSPIWDVLIFSQ